MLHALVSWDVISMICVLVHAQGQDITSPSVALSLGQVPH